MDDEARFSWYQSFLPSSITDSGEPRMVVPSFTSDHGFSARLTMAELDVISKKPGFVYYWGPHDYACLHVV